MKNLATLFTDLVSIPSPSGSEAGVAAYINNYLKASGLKTQIDGTGAKNDSNSGNLIAYLQGKGPTLLFVAHMDTVEVGDIPVKPVTKNNTIKSNGNTILGADDKAAIASILSALPVIKTIKNHPNIVFVFSTREENGIMGVNFLKLNREVDMAFIFDGSEPVGTFAYKSLGYLSFSIRIHGKEAHAAKSPEKGRNAIKAMALAVSRMQLGKNKRGDTLNIGRISGGNKLNVIPGIAVIEGEIRAFKKADMLKTLDKIEKIVQKSCKNTDCKYELTPNWNDFVEPFFTQNKKMNKIGKIAAKDSKLRFSYISLDSTLEAGILTRNGYPALVATTGGKMPHSKEESITTTELEDLKRLIIGIVKTVAKTY